MKKIILSTMMFLFIGSIPAGAAIDFGGNHAEQKKEKNPPAKQKVKESEKETNSTSIETSVEEPEAMKKFKAIQNQEQWVAKLQKQLNGETAQLNEMRSSLAQAFSLDVKKLEKDAYEYDMKSGKIVEKINSKSAASE